MVFDNAKLRGLVPGFGAAIPFEQGAREIVDWYDADPARQRGRRRGSTPSSTSWWRPGVPAAAEPTLLPDGSRPLR